MNYYNMTNEELLTHMTYLENQIASMDAHQNSLKIL